ncbi:hypothetical protein BD626DRAFT_208586 [Schizophyllum amplum]|uniref:Uncharacterized protein n=1 Tax=Schizophyllum amplum TaxID=97359 RepID=A0A550BYR3_9AGAR|nr:hypothetical protein BD626DRAFT_208586 [Auriculariopsis ampla]
MLLSRTLDESRWYAVIRSLRDETCFESSFAHVVGRRRREPDAAITTRVDATGEGGLTSPFHPLRVASHPFRAVLALPPTRLSPSSHLASVRLLSLGPSHAHVATSAHILASGRRLANDRRPSHWTVTSATNGGSHSLRPQAKGRGDDAHQDSR